MTLPWRGAYVVLSLDPVSSLKDIDDPVVEEELRNMKCGRYVATATEVRIVISGQPTTAQRAPGSPSSFRAHAPTNFHVGLSRSGHNAQCFRQPFPVIHDCPRLAQHRASGEQTSRRAPPSPSLGGLLSRPDVPESSDLRDSGYG